MAAPELPLTVTSDTGTGSGSVLVYVGTPAMLTVSIENDTGDTLTLSAGAAASTLTILMPSFYTLDDLNQMQVGLDGWTPSVNAASPALVLTYAGTGATWNDGTSLAVTIANASSASSPTTDSIVVQPTNISGNVPIQTSANLSLLAAPVKGNPQLQDVLEVTLDNQGTVFASMPGDELTNMLVLNLKNTGATPLCSGSSGPGSARVIVTFVYGNTTGALTTDADKAAPPDGSAWNITCVVKDPQLNDWAPTNPASTDDDAHPQWILRPSPDNPGGIGTGANANVTVAFSNLVTFAPPGHTQMSVLFTGFAKDDQTNYDDALFVLDIVKQPRPATSGALDFFSPETSVPVTIARQPIPVPVRWTLFDVTSITIVCGSTTVYTKTYPQPISALTLDGADVTIPLSQDEPLPPSLTLTLQAYDGTGNQLNALQYAFATEPMYYIDPKDGQVYPLVALAGRVWFARNFAYDCDGSVAYPDAPSSEAYGRLYPPVAAADCLADRPGWRIPAMTDFEALEWVDFSGFNPQLGGYYGGKFYEVGQAGKYLCIDVYWSYVVFRSESNLNLDEAAGEGESMPPRAYSLRFVRDA